MALLNSLDELTKFTNDLLPSINGSNQLPILFQKFIPHTSYVKVYVIGNKIFPVAKSFTMPASLTFNTQTCSSVIPCHLSDTTLATLTALAHHLSRHTSLSLFGFDIIFNADDISFPFYLVDLNYFPSYKNIENSNVKGISHLAHFIIETLNKPKC